MPEQVDSPATYGSKGDASLEAGSAPSSFENQDQDEKETVRQHWKRYGECRDHKHTIVRPNDWQRYAKLYGDQHWDASMYEDWQSTPTINLCFAAIQAQLPILTDNKPQIAVIEREPDDTQIAGIIGKVIEWILDSVALDLLLPKTMLNALIFGNGFMKVIWNPALRMGVGDIDVLNVDPTNIFFNPEATDWKSVTEVRHVEQMPLSWLKAMYPDKAEMLGHGGLKDGSIIVNRPQEPQRVSGRGEPVEVKSTTGTSYTYPAGSTSSGQSAPKQSATVMEAWVFQRDSNRWRKTVIANDVLLDDQITDFDTPPFVHFVDYPVGWTIWASGEIQHVESLQYEINRRRGMALDIMRHCAMPMLVVDPASGVDHETIKARPNLVIPAEGGPAAVGVLAPQMDLGGIFQINDRDKEDFNGILGNVDIIQGKTPPRVEAGVALEILAESANTRLRAKVRYMEAALQRLGQIIIKMVQKYYTGPRIFRIVGNEFSSGGVPQQAQFFATNQPVGMEPDPAGQMQPTFDETSNFIPPDAEFDVKIGAGSTLPISKTARFQQAITLFDRGAIDQEELLKSAAWPKWEEVLQRMQFQQMQMMMQQQGVAPEGVPQLPGSAEELIGEEPPQEAA